MACQSVEAVCSLKMTESSSLTRKAGTFSAFAFSAANFWGRVII